MCALTELRTKPGILHIYIYVGTLYSHVREIDGTKKVRDPSWITIGLNEPRRTNWKLESRKSTKPKILANTQTEKTTNTKTKKNIKPHNKKKKHTHTQTHKQKSGPSKRACILPHVPKVCFFLVLVSLFFWFWYFCFLRFWYSFVFDFCFQLC